MSKYAVTSYCIFRLECSPDGWWRVARKYTNPWDQRVSWNTAYNTKKTRSRKTAERHLNAILEEQKKKNIEFNREWRAVS